MPAVKSKRSGQVFVVVAYLVALLAAAVPAHALAGRHPILIAAAADVAATIVVFLFSVGLDNSSVYDPYWSVAPLPIALYWIVVAGNLGPRQLAILALVALWGVRLTANWAMRWRGPADEDFRYVEIRGKTGRAYWPASFAAIHLMPTVWVFLGLLPLYPALTRAGFGALDVVAIAVTALAIALETIADRQLYRFLRSPHDPADVLATGLWARCRHPNYLGEILFWWGLFLFGLAAAPAWAWTLVGPLSITLLFVFVSVPWMDRRMLERHPKWAEHMKTVRALLPWQI
jgi:steroid 5-alpha reductase family enzyme